MSAIRNSKWASVAFAVATGLAFSQAHAQAPQKENWKMQSAFAAVRLLGGQVMLAYAVQAVLAVAVCAVLVMLLRRRPGTTAEAPAVAAAALLISPFLLDYDLVLLAVRQGAFADRKRVHLDRAALGARDALQVDIGDDAGRCIAVEADPQPVGGGGRRRRARR